MIICITVKYCGDTGILCITLIGDTIPPWWGLFYPKPSVSILKTVTLIPLILHYSIIMYHQILFYFWYISHIPYTQYYGLHNAYFSWIYNPQSLS